MWRAPRRGGSCEGGRAEEMGGGLASASPGIFLVEGGLRKISPAGRWPVDGVRARLRLAASALRRPGWRLLWVWFEAGVPGDGEAAGGSTGVGSSISVAVSVLFV